MKFATAGKVSPEFAIGVILDQIKADELQLDPGVACLFFGKQENKWAIAQTALKRIGVSKGGAKIVNSALKAHLDNETMATSELRFLQTTCVFGK